MTLCHLINDSVPNDYFPFVKLKLFLFLVLFIGKLLAINAFYAGVILYSTYRVLGEVYVVVCGKFSLFRK